MRTEFTELEKDINEMSGIVLEEKDKDKVCVSCALRRAGVLCEHCRRGIVACWFCVRACVRM